MYSASSSSSSSSSSSLSSSPTKQLIVVLLECKQSISTATEPSPSRPCDLLNHNSLKNIHQSKHSLNPSFSLSIHPSAHPSIHSFIHPSIHPHKLYPYFNVQSLNSKKHTNSGTRKNSLTARQPQENNSAS